MKFLGQYLALSFVTLKILITVEMNYGFHCMHTPYSDKLMVVIKHIM